MATTTSSVPQQATSIQTRESLDDIEVTLEMPGSEDARNGSTNSSAEPNLIQQEIRTVFVCGFMSRRLHNQHLQAIINDLTPHYFVARNQTIDQSGTVDKSVDGSKNLLRKSDIFLFLLNEFTVQDDTCLLLLQLAWAALVPIIMLRKERLSLRLEPIKTNQYNTTVRVKGTNRPAATTCVTQNKAPHRRQHREAGGIKKQLHKHIDTALIQNIMFVGFHEAVDYSNNKHDIGMRRLMRQIKQAMHSGGSGNTTPISSALSGSNRNLPNLFRNTPGNDGQTEPLHLSSRITNADKNVLRLPKLNRSRRSSKTSSPPPMGDAMAEGHIDKKFLEESQNESSTKSLRRSFSMFNLFDKEQQTKTTPNNAGIKKESVESNKKPNSKTTTHESSKSSLKQQQGQVKIKKKRRQLNATKQVLTNGVAARRETSDESNDKSDTESNGNVFMVGPTQQDRRSPYNIALIDSRGNLRTAGSERTIFHETQYLVFHVRDRNKQPSTYNFPDDVIDRDDGAELISLWDSGSEPDYEKAIEDADMLVDGRQLHFSCDSPDFPAPFEKPLI